MRHCDTFARMADLLTSAQVAVILGRSQRTVQRLVTTGKLTPRDRAPGGQRPYLFAREDVDALLAEAAA